VVRDGCSVVPDAEPRELGVDLHLAHGGGGHEAGASAQKSA
jgi:hypothetical protein